MAAVVVAAVVVAAALLVPAVVGDPPTPAPTVPVEAALVAVLLTVLPGHVRTPVATTAGVVLGAATVLRLADLGFLAALAEPMDPLTGWELLGNGYEFLRGALGPAGAVVAAVLAGLLAVGVVAACSWAVRRLSRGLVAARPGVLVGVVATALVLPVLVGSPPTATTVVAGRLQGVADDLADRDRFAAVLADDPYSEVADATLLTGLRGRDVVMAFVESYGVTALDDLSDDLTSGTARLETAGFGARSAYLTSSTFGGRSWLAHATLLTGTWTDSQRRYRQALASDRMSFNRAFGRAGWRTVGVAPGTTGDWPDGAFYGFDAFYDSRTLGYRGPNFSWATMPDQYTLAAFERLERGRRDRPPVMAEIQLVSSHAPWTPTPTVLPWSQVGDGSVYRGSADVDEPASAILTRDPSRARADYLTSIRYSLASLVSYVEAYGDDRLVLILLGDHQPNPIVTGPGARADVPVTVVARDRGVLDRIDSWGWSTGLRPDRSAPVWRMDAFRDRFLAAYGG